MITGERFRQFIDSCVNECGKSVQSILSDAIGCLFEDQVIEYGSYIIETKTVFPLQSVLLYFAIEIQTNSVTSLPTKTVIRNSLIYTISSLEAQFQLQKTSTTTLDSKY